MYHTGRAAPVAQVAYTFNHRQHTSGKVMVGGSAADVAATLNPVSGRGLSHLIRTGCVLHQRCRGTGGGVTLRLGSRIHAAAAHFLDAGRHPPLPTFTLGCLLQRYRYPVVEQASLPMLPLHQVSAAH